MLIDIHVHVTPSSTVTRADGTTYCTPEELLAKLDKAGIEKAVLLPMVTPECNHRHVSNEDVLDIAARYRERFIPFCNLDPRQIGNSPDTDFIPHLEHYKAAGCKGLGEITANLAFDDPLVENLLQQCEAIGMPILFHIGPQFGGCYGLVDDLGLPKLEGILQKFPKLTVIGHSQPFWSEIGSEVTVETRGGYPKGKVVSGKVPELLRKYPNMYGDMSAGSGFNAVSRDPEFGYTFMEEFQDKLLFGTDICAPHNETPLVGFLEAAVEEGNVSSAAYEKITWGNANRILGLGLGD